MANRRKSGSRAARRREDAAIKLIALGGGFAVVPLFLQASPLGKAFSGLIPIGILMLVAGGVMLWLIRRQGSAAEGPSYLDGRALSPEPFAGPIGARPADRVVDEFVRASAEAKLASQAPATRPTTWSPDVFAQIEWRRFEAVVEALFQQSGLVTKSQSHGADGGVDVWLYSRAEPEIPVGLVQCKHWQGRQVGVDKIRELRGVMAAKKVGRGLFATTSTFTADARRFARANSIDMLDVDALLSTIVKRSQEQQKALLEVALEGDYWIPTCPTCGVKMVPRRSRKDGGKFWGCKHYPGCRARLPIRAM